VSNPVLKQAEVLEEMLPEVMRTLFPGGENEPLSELTVAQMRIMRVLSKGPLTVTALAERLNVSLPGMTQQLSRLEAAGMVSKTTSADDRRTRLVSLTEGAEQLLKSRRSRRTAHAAGILCQMSPAQRDALIAALNQLIESSAR
jgi:DNA-binding MarR family transcriptional regulator